MPFPAPPAHLPDKDEVADCLERWRHRRGVASDAAGLSFVGLRFQHRMTSALLGGVGRDAAFIAGGVLQHAEIAAAT